MAEARIRGVRLTREERLAVRRLISGGCSFEEAAAAVRCSTKTVQRLLNTVGGMPPRCSHVVIATFEPLCGKETVEVLGWQKHVFAVCG